ncbi:BTAD domain-containing putative transcriptional regulator [Longimicrobium sp.]|uniref:BTAD domain-containing putative transcriptional regulator n=1 Tax=Longimicrobium sp. TaxID=2029185 RepID=UPI002EDA5F77
MGGRAAHKRRLALLAVLAAARGRMVARERLIALLWPDTSGQAGRHSLSESLSVLRREIDDELFVSASDELGLNVSRVECDVALFEDALDAGNREEAAALYRGPFLDGFYVSDAPDFDRWADAERDRLGRAYARALDSLADEARKRGDSAAAIEWLRRLAAHDPYSSRVALHLLKSLEQAGEREAALRHAAVHAAFLREELGTEPSPELQALVERLRHPPAASASPPLDGEAAGNDRDGGAELRSVTIAKGSRGQGESGQPAVQDAADARSAPAGCGERPTGTPAARRTAAVLFADIVGFTALGNADAEAAARVLSILQEAAREEVRRGNGHVVEFIGDGVLAEFAEPVACARAAGRLTRRFEHRTGAAGARSTLRAGIHVGEVATTDDGSLYGEAVSLAPQLQERAEPGHVLVSAELLSAVRRVPDFRFASRGTTVLPGRVSPVATFDLHLARRSGRVPPARADRPGVPVRRTWAVLAIAIAAALVSGSIGLLRARSGPPEAQRLPANRVAVFYFQDQSPGRELEHVARGLTDQLIHELSQVGVLDVVPPSGVRRFRESRLPMDSVAAELGAGTLLEGSLHRSGDRIRLYLHFVDVSSGERLRSAVLNATMDDPFVLEERLAREASRFLRWRLGRSLEVRVHSTGTRSARARDLLLRAEQLREEADSLLKGRDPVQVALGKRQLAYADSLLVKAEQADPGWSAPAALRGSVMLRLASASALPEERRLLAEARARVDRALRLRPGDAGALETRGTIFWTQSLFHQRADSAEALVDAAVADLRAAVDTDPLRAGAWSTLSQVLRFQGDHEGAYFAAHRAFRADAYLLRADEVRYRLFRSAVAFGRFDLAEEQCAAGANEFPGDWRFVECRLVIMARTDTGAVEVARAERLLADVNAAHPPPVARAAGSDYLPVYRQMLFAAVLARAGAHERARSTLERARAEVAAHVELRASFAYDEAHVRLFLGDRPGAVRALAELVRIQPFMRRFVANDHLFRTLEREPAFQSSFTPGGSPPGFRMSSRRSGR